MKPLDLTEWSQSLRTASDHTLSEFGNEVLELIENEPFNEECREIRETLEQYAKREFKTSFSEHWRLTKFFTDRCDELAENNEKLAQAGFTGSGAIDDMLAEFWEMKAELAGLKSGDIPLVYDL